MPERFASLNLPPHFVQLIQNRAVIDAWLLDHLRVETGRKPTPVAPRLIRTRNPEGMHRIDWSLPAATRDYRAGLPQIFNPPRGFRAPILDDSTNWFHLLERTRELTEAEREAAQLIHHRLAYDGLLPTLAQVMAALGPRPFLTNGTAGLRYLNALGFPDDLLACFSRHETAGPTTGALEVVSWIAGHLARGETVASLQPRLTQRPFRFPGDWSRFEIASESGHHEPGLLRMQLGGGFADGIVAGDSLHVVAQLIAGLPQADALISVPADVIEPVQSWVRQTFPVRRAGHVTLIRSPGQIESWAQDNGKAGTLREPSSGSRVPATLTPRYASRQEGLSYFLPSESFLIDGLTHAGLQVVHFPLLFQGGNMLAVRHPTTGRRTLLIGEGEINRNLALGLTREQITEGFRRGFGVDDCVPLPAVSYHLDFDVNVRAIGDELVAFVNDPPTATRMIVGLGIDALERHGLLDQPEAAALRYDLSGTGGRLALTRLATSMAAGRLPDGTHRDSLATLFRRSSSDSGAGNLQVFLQALVLLESELTTASAKDGIDAERADVLRALREMDVARRAQRAALARLGFRIVRVPSLPNFYRSINYLNGIHHRAGYVIPAFGGFYAELDATAEKVFREELGPDAAILRVQCAELQRKHGAVHCAVVAHPLLPAETPAQGAIGF